MELGLERKKVLITGGSRGIAAGGKCAGANETSAFQTKKNLFFIIG